MGMEWFKHKTASLDDPDICDFMDEFGDAGYVMFFGLLEIYGREFNKLDDSGFLTLNLNYISRKLRKTSAKTASFLRHGATLKRFTLKDFNGKPKMVTFKISGFLDIASNWTKRQHRRPTEVPTPDLPHQEGEGEVEGEGEKTYRCGTAFFKDVIGILNESMGTNYKHTTEATRKKISGRFNEGYSLKDFRLVIQSKVSEWRGTDSEKYLNPDTLFRPSKFEKYLQAARREKLQDTAEIISNQEVL